MPGSGQKSCAKAFNYYCENLQLFFLSFKDPAVSNGSLFISQGPPLRANCTEILGQPTMNMYHEQ